MIAAPHTQSQPEADELRDYVVRRGGGFYRPRAQGYTQSIGEAGRWTRADANLYAVNCEGVTVHHVSEFPPDTIATLQARVDELTKALTEISELYTGGGYGYRAVEIARRTLATPLEDRK